MTRNVDSAPMPGRANPAQDAELVTIRPATSIATKQGLPYFVGISQATVNASGISMSLVVIPPGAVSEPHCHKGYETAIYVLEGKVETRYGPGLAKTVVNQAGDFLFVPPDVPHQSVNMSATEPARAIIARNDANEQERVVPYDVASGR
jgi:uncharacterized RmlC-like cupin family protein